MSRFLATTATMALCAAWMLALPARASDDVTSVAASATDTAPAPDDAAQPKTMLDAINIQIAKAKALRLQGDVDDAAKAYAQLMLVAPDNPALLGEYGKAMAQQGHSQAAVTLLVRAIQLQPGDWTYYSALGVSYDQLGKRKEAREAYDRALALKPGEASVLNNYAMSRMLAGDYAGARKMFEQIQAAGSNDPKVAANLAKLAALEAAHQPKTTTPVIVAAKPSSQAVAVATLDAPKAPSAVAKGGVMMEKVPADPLAGPVGKTQATHAPIALASAAPKPLVKASAPVHVAAPAPATVVAEKINPATTMMQKIPVDPLAGPVAPHVAAVPAKKSATKVAHIPAKIHMAAAKPVAEKPKAVVAKAMTQKLSAPPALRTASDN